MGLYRHIRHAEGLETMKRYLDKRKINQCRQIAYINWPNSRQSLIFSSWDKIYSIKSWALPLVRNYVNIFMAQLEKEIFSNTEFQPVL